VILAPRPGDEADADEALLFVYDGWNRLVKVYKDDGATQGQIDESDTLVATYEYDGLGRRIQKTVGETTDDYYYNESWQVLETRRGGDPDPLDQYVWDVRYVDAPVVRFHDGNTDGDYLDAGDNVLYYTTDANWDVMALVDADTGDVVERYMYDAYGKATVLNGANGTDPDVNGSTVFEWDPDADGLSDVANDILFAGYRFDAETGLYHVRNRQYHPTLGRWIERDPAGYVDGLNLSAYVSGNPAGLTDPTGLYGETAPESAGNSLIDSTSAEISMLATPSIVPLQVIIIPLPLTPPISAVPGTIRPFPIPFPWDISLPRFPALPIPDALMRPFPPFPITPIPYPPDMPYKEHTKNPSKGKGDGHDKGQKRMWKPTKARRSGRYIPQQRKRNRPPGTQPSLPPVTPQPPASPPASPCREPGYPYVT
jgi:RHS repeat-associated protein